MKPVQFENDACMLVILAPRSQAEALDELYGRWQERFGKKALDHLLVLWAGAEARLSDADRYREALCHQEKMGRDLRR